MKQELSIRTQDGILDFAQAYVRNNNIILSKNYDVKTAMANLYLDLIQVVNKNGKPALEVCTPESIQEAITKCINEELDVGKDQAYLICYGDKLICQPSYFGNVNMCYRKEERIIMIYISYFFYFIHLLYFFLLN